LLIDGSVAKDLYQTTTHFLLELIQNADDNFYEVEFPTLSITYIPGRVRIDCNERGFTKKNIEAITRICKSTKSGRSKSAGFVGEKGIGFKAVFKVASAVWISSGHYSFKFDRDAHLGMIAPIWDTFPEKLREGYTSILLKLSQDCDENRIISELESYDERMLLFLRRLRKLEIDVTPKIGYPSTSKPFRTFISRHSETLDNPSMTILTKNGLKRNYLVWRQTANNMPTETRRPNISSSEIVLAFPNTGFEGEQKLQPVIESQNVYAFLPIRNSGLPVSLHSSSLASNTWEQRTHAWKIVPVASRLSPSSKPRRYPSRFSME
jgi:HSP90 family molecular chaperone